MADQDAGNSRLTCVSGVGDKGPACFLVETAGVRLLLDLGLGPQPGLLPVVDNVGSVDALILSHGHKDHAGGLQLLDRIGNPPIHATQIVAQRLKRPDVFATLPLQGTTRIAGVDIETGRDGHAPGGVWIRLNIGQGLLYTGDYSVESPLYAYDPPPPADCVILDASYGAALSPLAEGIAAIFDTLSGDSAILPVPADGRGPEIALTLWRHGNFAIELDPTLESSIRRLANEDAGCLREGVAADLAALIDAPRPKGASRRVLLCGPADGSSGASASAIAASESDPGCRIVFTGYVPKGTTADRLVHSGRAQYVKWNVHPRLSDNVDLLWSSRARVAIPAFCPSAQTRVLADACPGVAIDLGRVVIR